MLDTLFVLLRRWFRREQPAHPPSQPSSPPAASTSEEPPPAAAPSVPPALNVEQALRDFYRLGKEAGRREKAVVYTTCCPTHSVPLEPDVLFGYYHCPACTAAFRAQEWQPQDERVTSRLDLPAVQARIAASGRPLSDLLVARRNGAGEHTALQKAIQKQQLREQAQHKQQQKNQG